LREVAALGGLPAYLVDGAEQIEPHWLQGRARIGVTAGASAPEILVRQVLERLGEMGIHSVRKLGGTPETMKFPLPKGLKLIGEAERRLEHLR